MCIEHAASDAVTGCGCAPAASARLSIIDFIERGYARRRRPPLAVAGSWQEDDEGRRVRFSLAVAGGVIGEVGFEAPSCTTLVAYCELAAERVTGLSLRDAVRRSGATELLALLPHVPPYKRALARLASAGMLAALAQSAKGDSG